MDVHLRDTPTVVATIDAIITAAIAALLARQLGAATGWVFTAGALAFAVVWSALFALQLRLLLAFRSAAAPRFPTPASADSPPTRT